MESFDVASDAFLTFKDLLQRHVKIVATFLDPEGPNYTKFFNHYEILVNSENYVTKRQALKVIFPTSAFIWLNETGNVTLLELNLLCVIFGILPILASWWAAIG